MYQAPDKKYWQGRTDHEDGKKGLRWHQLIKPVKLTQDVHLSGQQQNIAFLGFCCDEGVRRNKGRVGAQQGPDTLRQAMASLPVHFNTEITALFDAGNVICPNQNLETAQELLGQKVAYLLQHGFTPIVLGGGHEIAYGHYLGIHQHLKKHPEANFGIVNIDAHFDLRSYARTSSSGTPFRQIGDLRRNHNQEFNYLCLGIQQMGNTAALFAAAKQYNTTYLLAEELREAKLEAVKKQINAWMDKLDWFYLSLDLDGIAAPYAPGVSAPTAFGLDPFVVREIILHLLGSGKLLSMDIAELSPIHDQDNRTAKLAASYIFETVQALTNVQ
jgi:formiminoglutamase